MVGPSSSHTAGAVRIGLVTRRLLGEEPSEASLLLHGSFAATGRGHGTDKALIAGLLGMQPDDSRIADSFACAKAVGLKFSFGETVLRGAHPNSVLLRVRGVSGKRLEVVGASIGGGRIEIRELSGMQLCFSAEKPTIIVKNEDHPGSVADVSRYLAEKSINIATFQVTRSSRGGEAIMVIECDAHIDDSITESIRAIPGILSAVCINP